MLLETTAGQGSTLGWRFEQLGAIIERTARGERLGVCFDTCHVFAAGYPLETKKEYAPTMAQLDEAVGLARVKAFHLNDSKQAARLARRSPRSHRPRPDGPGAVRLAAQGPAVCENADVSGNGQGTGKRRRDGRRQPGNAAAGLVAKKA